MESAPVDIRAERSRDPVKIGMVTEFFYPQPGGVSEHIRAVSHELGLLGHETVVLTSRIRGEIPENGPRVLRMGRSLPIRYNGSLSRITVGGGLQAQMNRLLDQERFDLLHVHNPFMPTLPLLALRNRRCPIVATFHSCYRRDVLVSLFHSTLERLAQRIDARVAVSLSAQRTVGRLFPAEYHIVPNGVDYDLFCHAAEQRRRERAEGRRPPRHRVLFVGALVWRKGLPTLIRALTILHRQRQDFDLLVVGDGPGRGRVRRMLPAELREKVHFLGFIPRHRLVECYAKADVFCAPARGRESFGMVLLEAMAAGLPIVASDIEGYRNVLSHGLEGLLVPPDDPQALARALSMLFDSPEECAQFGHRGQLKAAGLRWREIARQLEGIYRDAAGVPEAGMPVSAPARGTLPVRRGE
jgi:phosphatidylinositol alpha-mannosyltransferase